MNKKGRKGLVSIKVCWEAVNIGLSCGMSRLVVLGVCECVCVDSVCLRVYSCSVSVRINVIL